MRVCALNFMSALSQYLPVFCLLFVNENFGESKERFMISGLQVRLNTTDRLLIDYDVILRL